MRSLFLLIVIFFITFLSSAQQRNCGTMQYLEYSFENNQNLENGMIENEIALQNWIQKQAKSINSVILTIPVVVHVIWNTNSENISDAQIQSQIDVLNEDFRRIKC